VAQGPIGSAARVPRSRRSEAVGHDDRQRGHRARLTLEGRLSNVVRSVAAVAVPAVLAIAGLVVLVRPRQICGLLSRLPGWSRLPHRVTMVIVVLWGGWMLVVGGLIAAAAVASGTA